MAAARKSKSRRKKTETSSPRPARPQESQSAEGITVAWMLAAMGTGLAELVIFVSMAALAYEPFANRLPERVSVLPWLLLFVAVITGSFSLLLTPMVLKQRHTPPPASVVNFALFVGALAWALLLGSLWL